MRPIAILLSLVMASASMARADGDVPPPAEPAPVAPAGEPAPTAVKADPPPPAVDPVPAPAPAAAPAKPVGMVDDGPVSKLRVGAWVGVACTVATLTAGAIFGLAAQSRADEISRRLVFVDANNQPRPFDQSAQKDDKNLRNEGKLYNGLAIGFYSAAGVLAIVTTSLFAVDAVRKNKKQKQASILPIASPNLVGLAVGGTF